MCKPLRTGVGVWLLLTMIIIKRRIEDKMAELLTRQQAKRNYV